MPSRERQTTFEERDTITGEPYQTFTSDGMVLGGRLRISVGGGAAGTEASDSALYRLRVRHPTANTYSHRKSSQHLFAVIVV